MLSIMRKTLAILSVLFLGCGGSDGDQPATDDAADDVMAEAELPDTQGWDGGGDAATDSVNSETAPPPAKKFLDRFPVGVDAQPQYSWDKWKMRGIDTLCRAELQDKTLAWLNDQAKAAGLPLIRQPLDKPSDDIGNPALLAWSHNDEPDLKTDTTPPSMLKATYDAWKKVDPTRLVFVNISGWNLWNMPSSSKCDVACYKQIAQAADWIGNDYYPVNLAQDVDLVGKAVSKAREISGDKPQLAYIEASDQELPWAPAGKAPTGPQLHAEIWDAIVHGARGICYFPQKIGGGFSYDNSTPEIQAEMTKQNALLKEIGGHLQGEIDPAPYKATVAAPLEAGWRTDAGKTYFIVVNLKSAAVTGATITLGGVTATTAAVHGESRSVSITGGAIKDDFAGYAFHVYEVE